MTISTKDKCVECTRMDAIYNLISGPSNDSLNLCSTSADNISNASFRRYPDKQPCDAITYAIQEVSTKNKKIFHISAFVSKLPEKLPYCEGGKCWLIDKEKESE